MSHSGSSVNSQCRAPFAKDDEGFCTLEIDSTKSAKEKFSIVQIGSIDFIGRVDFNKSPSQGSNLVSGQSALNSVLSER